MHVTQPTTRLLNKHVSTPAPKTLNPSSHSTAPLHGHKHTSTLLTSAAHRRHHPPARPEAHRVAPRRRRARALQQLGAGAHEADQVGTVGGVAAAGPAVARQVAPRVAQRVGVLWGPGAAAGRGCGVKVRVRPGAQRPLQRRVWWCDLLCRSRPR